MKRTRQHEIDDEAQTILRKNTPRNWSLSEPNKDYGIDYLVQVFDKDTEEATKITFFMQLKGTENYKKSETHVKFRIGNNYLKYYYGLPIPVFLVVIDVINEEYCWLFIQKYINEELNDKKPSWESQETVTLHIPIENTFLNPEIMEKCASEGSQYCNILVNGTPTHEIVWKVKNITDDPSKKSEDIKSQYSALFNAETKVGFEFIHNQNDPEHAKKLFQSVYDKTNGDETNVMHHLNSIIGLSPLLDLENDEEREKLFEYIEEGEALSKKNNIKYLEYYFYGYRLEQLCFILQNQLLELLITQKIANLGNNPLTLAILIATNPKTIDIFNMLHKLYADFSTNLMGAFEENELFVSLELLRMLIGMQLHHIQAVYSTTDKNTQKALFNQIKQLISIFKDLINFSSEFKIFKYDLLTFEATYLYLTEDKNYKTTVEDYISFSQENDSQYHLQRAKSLKEKFAQPLKRKKDITEMSDEEIHDLLKTLIFTIAKIDIDVDESDEAIALRQAVMDLNPKRVLENCKNMELHYGSGGLYTKFFGLASDGFKTIYCEYGGIVTNWNLDDAYSEFYNKYCKECEHKTQQDFKWNPEKLSYVKSAKFKEILNKNPFIK